MRFFKMGDQLSPADAFAMFGAAHIALLIFCGVFLLMTLHHLKKMPAGKAEKLIRMMAVAVPVLEFSHTIWLYLCGHQSLIKLLPLHLCAMQSLFIPLAVFTKKTCFQEFIYATSVLGGIFGILFPTGVAEVYPLFHYQTIQTVLLHMLLILVPLALIVTGAFRPSARNFPKVLLIFLCVAFVAAVVDFSSGENYMFLNLPPQGTPLVWFYEYGGHLFYLLTTFVVLAGISLSMYLPFQLHAHKQAKLRQAEEKGSL